MPGPDGPPGPGGERDGDVPEVPEDELGRPDPDIGEVSQKEAFGFVRNLVYALVAATLLVLALVGFGEYTRFRLDPVTVNIMVGFTFGSGLAAILRGVLKYALDRRR